MDESEVDQTGVMQRDQPGPVRASSRQAKPTQKSISNFSEVDSSPLHASSSTSPSTHNGPEDQRESPQGYVMDTAETLRSIKNTSISPHSDNTLTPLPGAKKPGKPSAKASAAAKATLRGVSTP